MRFLLPSCVCLGLLGSALFSFAASDDEATPRPKKKPGAHATPSAKKKAAADTDEDAKPPATPAAVVKKKAVNGEGGTPGSTPKPKPATPDPETKPGQKGSDDPVAKPVVPDAAATTHFPAVSIASSELQSFAEQPPQVRQLIEEALALATQNLTYKFGSDDPANGGMDCSGTVAYLLRQHGFEDVPRDASSQYVWARKNGQFFAVISKKTERLRVFRSAAGRSDVLEWHL